MITFNDLFLVGFLAFLEAILSIDNALVLAVMARHLPGPKQRKALTYGLWGSVIFRLSILSIATKLIQSDWVKYLGGAYLIIIALHHLLRDPKKNPERLPRFARGFWPTVIMIELMDIAFAVDSILAAVALTQKFWIIFVGGMIGVILMRFAAALFIKLLNLFPRFETSAYLLVLLIGLKLLIEATHLSGVDFHDMKNPASWVLWSSFLLSILYGLRPKSRL